MLVNREELLALLQMLRPGLTEQEAIEQSSCFVFQEKKAASGKNICHAMTFNDEVACRHRSPLKITGAVPAKPFLGILEKMPEEELDIDVVGDKESQLVIVGKRRKMEIRMERDIALQIDTVDQPETWSELPDDFSEAIRIVEHCAAKKRGNEDRFAITCVHIHPKWVEAFDNMQAARYTIKTGVSSPHLVRQASIHHIIGMGMTEFSETDHWIHFRNPDRFVMSMRRTYDDEGFLELDRFFNEKGVDVVLPKGLAEAAERAAVASTESGNQGFFSVSLSPDKLKIVGMGSVAKYSESKKIPYDGPRLEFMISPELLREVLNRHTECQIGKKTLLVDGGKWKYVTSLAVPDDDENRRESEE